jgi:tRNA1(Val) A37 N6-methylase TrmN6
MNGYLEHRSNPAGVKESTLGFATTNDRFLGGRLVVAQPRDGFRSGSDAVLLAATISAADGPALEIGCGAGVAMLCAAYRDTDLRVTGLELQPDLAALAQANAAANGLSDHVSVVAGDLRAPPPVLTGRTFGQAFANPPFFAAGRHDVSPVEERALARSEGEAGDLADWIAFMRAVVVENGVLTLIHRAERLEDILALLPGATVLPLLPAAGRLAKRVLVRARKGASGPARTSPGLVLHALGGGYTSEAEGVLRRAQPLAF